MTSCTDNIADGNSRAAYMREYKKRKRLEDNCNNVPKRTKLHAERHREYRETHKNVSAEYMHNYRKRKDQENNTPQASTSTEPTPTPIMYNYNQDNEYFQKNFIRNPFRYACDICDRLRYMNNLKQVKENHISVLVPEFPDMNVAQFKACVTCTAILDRDQVPSLSGSNGFTYPPYPKHLPPLDGISEMRVAPRFPFMQIRRLRHQMRGYGTVEQVINAPVDVNNIVTALPRQLDNDYNYSAHLKRSLIHKSTYLQGCI
jgi:hypothetical protein